MSRLGEAWRKLQEQTVLSDVSAEMVLDIALAAHDDACANCTFDNVRHLCKKRPRLERALAR